AGYLRTPVELRPLGPVMVSVRPSGSSWSVSGPDYASGNGPRCGPPSQQPGRGPSSMSTIDTFSRPRALLSWSTGKDSAAALGDRGGRGGVEVVGLLTTFNEAFDGVAMHAVPRALAEAQADALGLPLVPVRLPFPCTNEAYEARLKAATAAARDAGVTRL